jgi:hypothetical protein
MLWRAIGFPAERAGGANKCHFLDTVEAEETQFNKNNKYNGICEQWTEATS